MRPGGSSGAKGVCVPAGVLLGVFHAGAFQEPACSDELVRFLQSMSLYLVRKVVDNRVGKFKGRGKGCSKVFVNRSSNSEGKDVGVLDHPPF